MTGPRSHGILRFGAHTVQCPQQRTAALSRRERAVDFDHGRIERGTEPVKLGVADKGGIEHQDFGLAAVLVEHVLQVSEPGLEAHRPVLAQAVDRRIRHLAEILPEVVAERPVPIRKYRARRVVPHGRDRLLSVLDHGREHVLKLFHRVTRSDLPPSQFRAREHRHLGQSREHVVQLHDLLDPFAERLRCRQQVLDLCIMKEPALFDVDRDHLPGAERALLDDRLLVHGHHSGFGSRNQETLAGHGVAQRAQPVPV